MLISILIALEIHLVWIHQTYTHQTKPDITVRVRLACKVISLILTALIFSAFADNFEQWQNAKTSPPPAPSLESRAAEVERLVEALGGPEHYLRYLELQKVE